MPILPKKKKTRKIYDLVTTNALADIQFATLEKWRHQAEKTQGREVAVMFHARNFRPQFRGKLKWEFHHDCREFQELTTKFGKIFKEK